MAPSTPGRTCWRRGRLATSVLIGRMHRMGKYDGLRDFLRHRSLQRVTMSFAEVDAVVPGGLPPSAYRHRAWWANEVAGSHSHAKSWLEAGFVVAELNLTAARVTFSRR